MKRDKGLERTWAAAAGLALGVLCAQPAVAADDDLAVVRKAVAQHPAHQARPAERESPPAAAPAKAGRGKEPQWLKLRIVEKGQKDGDRVSINLPLALVRALDDDEDGPVHLKRNGRRLELSDLLRALDSGQEIVEIEDGQASIRIWVE